MFIKNKIAKYEKDICSVLTQLTYHIHPRIVEFIQKRNVDEFTYFKDLFGDKVDVNNYLFDGSVCVFPGVKRYVSFSLLPFRIKFTCYIEE